MPFQLSPGVNVSEIDLTTIVPSVGTTEGAFVGVFEWGPLNEIVSVSNEVELVDKFGKPTANTYESFFTAANFLAYGRNLRISRAANSQSALNATANSTAGVLISNRTDYEANIQTSVALTATSGFAAKYPGEIGNSLKIAVAANSLNFGSFAYASYFQGAPNTSTYAAGVLGARDEMHVVVVDEDGKFTGTANTVLERFSNLSKCSDAKGDDGSSIYYKEVLYRTSKWIHWLGHAPGSNAANAWGQTVAAASATGTPLHSPVIANYSFVNGTDGVPSQADFINMIDLFTNKEKIDVSLLFAGDCGISSNSSISTTLIANKYLNVADGRKDAVAFISPPYANSVTSTAKSTDVVNFRNGSGLLDTSYGVMDSGWKYQYDKYNDVYRWIPLNADVAGLCVRTDLQRDPWFSPAGLNRGQIRNLVKLSFNPTQAERDLLYKAGVNPVVSFPGEGTVLFGDKTMQGRPSAFDRINVRRLFIVLEKAISAAARSSLFEFNDEFTRSQFVALVEPFLRDVQGRRGVYDFRVVCDETNNTPAVIDRNEFVGDIYIKPARSVNFIQLNFVAVRSGVAFDEIVGRF